MRRGLIFLAIIALLLAAVATVQAAPQHRGPAKKASISGTVIGPDDKPVPRAAVTYQSSGGTAPHALHADAHGHFLISNLRGDLYEIRASKNGIFSEWEKNLEVRPGLTLVIAGGIEHHWSFRNPGIVAKLANELITIHHRHEHICDDQIRVLIADLLQRFGAILCQFHFVAETPEGHFQIDPEFQFIFGYKNS